MSAIQRNPERNSEVRTEYEYPNFELAPGKEVKKAVVDLTLDDIRHIGTIAGMPTLMALAWMHSLRDDSKPYPIDRLPHGRSNKSLKAQYILREAGEMPYIAKEAQIRAQRIMKAIAGDNPVEEKANIIAVLSQAARNLDQVMITAEHSGALGINFPMNTTLTPGLGLETAANVRQLVGTLMVPTSRVGHWVEKSRNRRANMLAQNFGLSSKIIWTAHTLYSVGVEPEDVVTMMGGWSDTQNIFKYEVNSPLPISDLVSQVTSLKLPTNLGHLLVGAKAEAFNLLHVMEQHKNDSPRPSFIRGIMLDTQLKVDLGVVWPGSGTTPPTAEVYGLKSSSVLDEIYEFPVNPRKGLKNKDKQLLTKLYQRFEFLPPRLHSRVVPGLSTDMRRLEELKRVKLEDPENIEIWQHALGSDTVLGQMNVRGLPNGDDEASWRRIFKEQKQGK